MTLQRQSQSLLYSFLWTHEIDCLYSDQSTDYICRKLVFFNLECRHIGRCPEAVKELSVLLNNKDKTHTLCLAYNSMEETSILNFFTSITKMKCLKTLDLGHNHLGSIGAIVIAAELSKFPNLTRLDLRNNRIRDSGVDTMSRLIVSTSPKLHSLCLMGNEITCDSFSAIGKILQTHGALRVLSLKGNDFGGGDIRCLWSASHNKSKCRSLDLSSCSINFKNAKRIAKELRFNEHLQSLNLKHNDIRMDGALRILEATAKQSILCELNMAQNNIDESFQVQYSAQNFANHTLKKLTLDNNILHLGIFSQLISPISNFKGLVSLQLKNCLLEEDSMQGIEIIAGNIANMRILGLSGNIIGFRGLAKISTVVQCHDSIEILELQSNHSTGVGCLHCFEAFLCLLHDNKKINTLKLRGNGIFQAIVGVKLVYSWLRGIYSQCARGMLVFSGFPLYTVLRKHRLNQAFGIPTFSFNIRNRDILAYFRHDFSIRLAFTMGMHERLGCKSAVYYLDDLIVFSILKGMLCDFFHNSNLTAKDQNSETDSTISSDSLSDF